MRNHAIDANYVVRYLIGDVQGHHKAAAEIFSDSISGKAQVSIDPVALFEAYYVLTKTYSQKEVEVRDKLAGLVESGAFDVDDDGVFETAVHISRKTGNKDLADCYHAAYAKLNGKGLETFDKDLAKLFMKL